MGRMGKIALTGWAFVFFVSALRAATCTWDGGGADNNWQTAANWSGDAAPADDGSATLAFSGGTRTAAVNDFAADTIFAGLSCLNDGTSGKTAAFTLSGNSITLGGNMVSTTASAAITDTISLPLLLSDTRTFTLNNNHHLTVSSIIGETGGSYGLVKGGGGNLTLNGANTYSGPTVMSGGQVYFNSIKNIGEGASSFGAPTTLESGTITNGSRLSYTGGSTTTDRPLVLTSGIQFDVSSSSSTLTMNGDITTANSSGVTFRGGGNFVLNGVINLGTSGAGRTDGGTVYLNCPTNPFTGDIGISAGAFSISNIANSGVACAIGKGTTITLGQHGWSTSGKLQFTGVSGGSCNRAIRIETTPGTTTYGGLIENTVAGQTLVLSGSVAPGSSSSTNQPRLQLIGAGNGELSGVISGSVKIEKNSGTGTWALSGENTYTGATAVSAGTLLVNGSTHADSAVSVASGGTLGGTGTVHGAVSIAVGGTLAPGVGGIGTLALDNADGAALTLNGGSLAFELGAEAGTCDRIDIAGGLVLNGDSTLALSFPGGSTPVGAYTLMTYGSKTGSGTLAFDHPYPNVTLDVGETAVTLTVTGGGTASALTWVGDGSANEWNTTAANWSPVNYGDNAIVIFDDTGSASPAVDIVPDPVALLSVTVNASSKAYTFGGAAITGTCGIVKSGTTALTLNGANAYSGLTAVNVGSLTLQGSGTVSDSATVWIADDGNATVEVK